MSWAHHPKINTAEQKCQKDFCDDFASKYQSKVWAHRKNTVASVVEAHRDGGYGGIEFDCYWDDATHNIIIAHDFNDGQYEKQPDGNLLSFAYFLKAIEQQLSTETLPQTRTMKYWADWKNLHNIPDEQRAQGLQLFTETITEASPFFSLSQFLVEGQSRDAVNTCEEYGVASTLWVSGTEEVTADWPSYSGDWHNIQDIQQSLKKGKGGGHHHKNLELKQKFDEGFFTFRAWTVDDICVMQELLGGSTTSGEEEGDQNQVPCLLTNYNTQEICPSSSSSGVVSPSSSLSSPSSSSSSHHQHLKKKFKHSDHHAHHHQSKQRRQRMDGDDDDDDDAVNNSNNPGDNNTVPVVLSPPSSSSSSSATAGQQLTMMMGSSSNGTSTSAVVMLTILSIIMCVLR